MKHLSTYPITSINGEWPKINMSKYTNRRAGVNVRKYKASKYNYLRKVQAELDEAT